MAPSAAAAAKPWPVCAFSKHFQWTTIQEMGEICARLGYDGVDLTLRPGGHVEPDRVEDDLPKAFEAVKKAGLEMPMVTAGIIDVSTPHTEKVLKTLSSLGIRRYRWGGFKYEATPGLPDQLAAFKPRVKDLAAMNHQYGLCAMYHTHSGVNQVGASQWDLYLLLKDFDPNSVSANYDLGHATVEGGYGGWIHSARLMLPYTRGMALKDFVWEKTAKGWVPGWCAFGKGMVNFKQYLSMAKAAGFQGPVQLHFEYPELGGADNGKKTFTVPKDRLIEIFRRDLVALRAVLAEV